MENFVKQGLQLNDNISIIVIIKLKIRKVRIYRLTQTEK